MIIKNCLAALPGESGLRKKDIRVASGKIAEISESINPGSEEIFDAEGYEVFPGAIDPHVHFDEPGFTHREDFLHGSMAAARGGVTTVIDMPCTSLPPVTTKAALLNKLAHIEKHSVVDFGLYGGVSGPIDAADSGATGRATAKAASVAKDGEEAFLADMEALAPYVLGFKCYFISGMETFTAVDHFRFRKALVRAAELGRPLLLHAEDPSFVYPATEYWKREAELAGREASWDDYANSRAEPAELSAVAAACALATGYAETLHIVHVGTAEAADIAFKAGASAETCPHYLAFSRDDFATHGSALKTAPPVKARGQTDKLWRLLARGEISFAASDHAPAPQEEKRTPSIWTDYGGIPGTGTLFPYLYSEGYRPGRVGLQRFLELTSGNAAKRFGLSGGKGSIQVGKDADFVFVNPARNYKIQGDKLLSKGTITPFEGKTFEGFVEATMVRGTLVWDDRAKNDNPSASVKAAAGHGKHITWGYA